MQRAQRQTQSEAAQIAKAGRRHDSRRRASSSSNTQKLYEICKSECKDTYYIQTLADLDSEGFPSVQCVGITAGASTPNKIIEEVSKHVRIKF